MSESELAEDFLPVYDVSDAGSPGWLRPIPQRFHSIIRDLSIRYRDGRHSASDAAS